MTEADNRDLVATRLVLHRVATHVLGRRRHAVTGRFGLRATPDGFGTPAYGDPTEVLRVAGTHLVREVGSNASVLALGGASLGEVAAFAGADLTTPFSAGDDTTPLGDIAAPLDVDPDVATALAEWFDLGWRSIDTTVAEAGAAGRATVLQLWPEHFDAGCSVAVGPGDGDRCNIGASPGDGFADDPYLYVGPWGTERPGDPAYWNAPFGAVLMRATVLAAADPVAEAVEFFRRGLSQSVDGVGG